MRRLVMEGSKRTGGIFFEGRNGDNPAIFNNITVTPAPGGNPLTVHYRVLVKSRRIV